MGETCGMSAGEAVDICKESNYPAGWDTFKQMYDSDGNHPSVQGTYLEGLIIASAMTGAPSRVAVIRPHAMVPLCPSEIQSLPTHVKVSSALS